LRACLRRIGVAWEGGEKRENTVEAGGEPARKSQQSDSTNTIETATATAESIHTASKGREPWGVVRRRVRVGRGLPVCAKRVGDKLLGVGMAGHLQSVWEVGLLSRSGGRGAYVGGGMGAVSAQPKGQAAGRVSLPHRVGEEGTRRGVWRAFGGEWRDDRVVSSATCSGRFLRRGVGGYVGRSWWRPKKRAGACVMG